MRALWWMYVLHPRAWESGSLRDAGGPGVWGGGPPLKAVCRAIGISDAEVPGAHPVGGGCINRAARLHTSRGRFFLKWNPGAGPRFFEAEAEGLAALAATAAVRIPSVIAQSGPGEAVAWLLLEWIGEGRPGQGGWRELGRRLAALHGSAIPGADPGPGRFGWHDDNLIGSLPQPNGWMDDWPSFWADRRIRPLARGLHARGVLSETQLAALEALADKTDELLGPASEEDGPSLLHGDLWSGNVLFSEDGRPVLIDPAVYVGHREVDLAMAELFGGFSPAFFESYADAWPLLAGYRKRSDVYRVYPLLVHAGLFGGGYAAAAVRAAEAALEGRR